MQKSLLQQARRGKINLRFQLTKGVYLMSSIPNFKEYYDAQSVSDMLGGKSTSDGFIACCPGHNDNRESLSIGEGDDGRTLLNCFAGCSTEEITDKIGISMSDLFPMSTRKQGKEIKETYVYTDEEDNTLYEVQRFINPDGSKTFRQRRPDGKGNYTYKTKGVRRVLYNLKFVLEDIEDGKPIFIVEGEKDAERLLRESDGQLVATTNAGGASSKWLDNYTESLKGAQVVIIPDNDEPGKKHAQKIAAAIHGKAKEVGILELPGVPEKGDLSDWFDAGNTIDDFISLAESKAESYDPLKTQVTSSDGSIATQVISFFEGNQFKPTRLGKTIMNDAPFFYNGSKLHVYKQGVYIPDGERIAGHLALEKLDEDYKEHYVSETINYLKRYTWSDHEAINQNDDYINVANGLLNWKTGELLPHDPDRISTIQIPVNYDPDATCTEVSKFLEGVVPRDTIQTVEELFGYLLLPSTSLEKAFMFTGIGANGKSTMINLMTRFIGQGNISNVPLQDLEGNRFKLAQVYGKLANIFADLSPKALDSSSVFKSVVSGDRMSAEFKGQDSFDFRPFARLIFSANEIPNSRDVGEAFFRRWIIIPFPNRFDHGKTANKNLINEITTEDELSGLLNLAVAGLQRIEANGCFTENESTSQALEQYKRDSDSVSTFIEEMCVINDMATSYTKEIYSAYSEWCDDCGLRALGKIRFNRKLQEKVATLKKDRKKGQPEHWNGIGLLDNPTGYGF